MCVSCALLTWQVEISHQQHFAGVLAALRVAGVLSVAAAGCHLPPALSSGFQATLRVVAVAR